MSKLQTQYIQMVSHLTALENFAALYGDKLDALDCGNLTLDACYDDSGKLAGYNIGLTWTSEDHRNTVLALLGEVFGKHDWIGRQDDKHVNWNKQVDGVMVTVFGAKRLPPPPPEAPVHPTEFPLQLADVVAEPADEIVIPF